MLSLINYSLSISNQELFLVTLYLFDAQVTFNESTCDNRRTCMRNSLEHRRSSLITATLMHVEGSRDASQSVGISI